MGIRPSAPNLKTSGGDRRQTTCSACRFGIFEDQPRVWSRKPLGLIHEWCASQPAVTRG